jgi:hypothetical protein
MNRTVITRGATALLLAFGLSACASSNSSSTRQVSYPVPDSPGIYAYTTKNDLRRIDGDPNWEASTWPERANLPSNTRFVVNDPALADRSPVGNVELWRVAWVRSEVNVNNQAMPMAGTEWALAPVAPYSVPVRLESPSNKRGVVNVVPTAPLAPGLYALRINEPGARQARVGVGWDSLDQRQYAAANCVDRYLGEGGIYRPCTAVVAAQPLAVVPTGTVLYSPGLSNPAPAMVAVPSTPVVATAPVTTVPATQIIPAPAIYSGLDIAMGEIIRRNNGLLIQGTVTNTSGQVQAIPPMQATLQDASGRDVQRWIFHPTASTLAPGARMAFRTEVRPVGADITSASVSFAR